MSSLLQARQNAKYEASLEKRLPRLPLPPDAKDWHFDHDCVLRNNVSETFTWVDGWTC